MDSCNTNKNRDEIYNESDEKKDNVDLNENNNADGVNSSDANQEADNVDMSVNDHKEKKNLLHINDILIFILSGLLVALALMFSGYHKERAEINKKTEQLKLEKAKYVSNKLLPSEYWCTFDEKKQCYLPKSYELINEKYKQSFYQFINQYLYAEGYKIDNYLNIRDNPEKYVSSNEKINHIYLIIKHKPLVTIDEAMKYIEELNAVILNESDFSKENPINPSTVNIESGGYSPITPAIVNRPLAIDDTSFMQQKNNIEGNINSEPIMYQQPLNNNITGELSEPNLENQPQPRPTISLTKIK